MTMPGIQREKLSNQVYTVLKQMIADYRFQPGARLVIEHIAKELDVSRTPVWEAVGRLEQEGLVENIPNRGVFMVALSAQETLNLYAVRQVLESMAARLAATRIDEQSLRKMADCVELQKEAVRKNDVLTYSKLDFQFHATVYESCGNSFLKEVLETIKNKMRPLTIHMDLDFSALLKHHYELIGALRKRDSQKAEDALRMHNEYMMAQIREDLENGRWNQLSKQA
jgi:DNA-binding GntR family transcriptional regulator